MVFEKTSKCTDFDLNEAKSVFEEKGVAGLEELGLTDVQIFYTIENTISGSRQGIIATFRVVEWTKKRFEGMLEGTGYFSSDRASEWSDEFAPSDLVKQKD